MAIPRVQALARLVATLGATHIVGLTTNVQFLRDVLQSPSFAQFMVSAATAYTVRSFFKRGESKVTLAMMNLNLYKSYSDQGNPGMGYSHSRHVF